MTSDQTSKPTIIYDGPVDDLLNGEGAFADGLHAAYREALKVSDRGGSALDIIGALYWLAKGASE